MNMKKSRRLKKLEQSIRDAKNKDDWVWKDESTLTQGAKEEDVCPQRGVLYSM